MCLCLQLHQCRAQRLPKTITPNCFALKRALKLAQWRGPVRTPVLGRRLEGMKGSWLGVWDSTHAVSKLQQGTNSPGGIRCTVTQCTFLSPGIGVQQLDPSHKAWFVLPDLRPGLLGSTSGRLARRLLLYLGRVKLFWPEVKQMH